MRGKLALGVDKPDSRQVASMRPARFAREIRHKDEFQVGQVAASMRPARFAREIENSIDAAIGVIELQ